MCSIPIEVLLMILEHVGKANLPTLCIHANSILIIRTLAQSTDLARRVRSFECPRVDSTSELVTALKNMSLLRMLDLRRLDSSILDGCTFNLDSFKSCFSCDESLRNF
jgi:hypothetical protein